MGSGVQNVRKWRIDPVVLHLRKLKIPSDKMEFLQLRKILIFKILCFANQALGLTCLGAVFLLSSPSSVSAQNKASFEVYVDAKEVPLGGYFDVTFTLKNANGTDFNPPSFESFRVVSGPATANSMQIVNGKVSREMSWTYTLEPKRMGFHRIDAASVKVNGKKTKTRSVSVRTVPGNPNGDNPLDNTSGATVKLLTNKEEVYLGEQFLLDLKLFTTVPIDGYDFGEDSEYRGFFAHELKRYLNRAAREVINGKQVTTKVLRRVALFPQQTGKLTIPAARAQLSVVDEKDRRPSFFRTVKPVYVLTDSLSINVLPLPPSAPETFTGAVGNFQMQASVARKQATTDDAISVTMLLEGDGDMKRVLAPVLLLSDSFEVYPPKVIEEVSSEREGILQGKKIIEYLILPKHPGNYQISPAFTFFNVEKEEYETLTAGPFPLAVKQGSNRQPSPRSRVVDELTENDIRFIKAETSLEKGGHSFVGSPVFWSLIGLPVLAFVGLFIFKKIKERETQVDADALKIKLASSEAQKRLVTAKNYLDAGDSRQFYDEVSKASLGYVSDKLSMPLSEMSKDNVREKLHSLKVSEPLIDDFVNVIKACEMALFAGMDNSADMAQTYEKAMAAINGIEGEVG